MTMKEPLSPIHTEVPVMLTIEELGTIFHGLLLAENILHGPQAEALLAVNQKIFTTSKAAYEAIKEYNNKHSPPAI